MSLLILCGVLAALLVIYDGFAILFLVKDYAVVHGCHASNVRVHTIWATNLWHYVLVSMLFATAFAVALIFVPLKRTIDATRKHFSRNRLAHPDKNGTLQYGLLSNLPDWLFLWVGTTLIMASMVVLVLAFWGYFELFMARPWCSDQKTAFEQLDLWHFARFTFVMQIILGSLLFTWGLIYWGAPFVLEFTSMNGHSRSDPLHAKPVATGP